jgi:hypothetical protein
VKEKPCCEVWHLRDERLPLEEVTFPDDYRLAARIQTASIVETRERIRRADFGRTEVTLFAASRRTRAYDVILDPEGRAYFIMPDGLHHVQREKAYGLELGR